MTWWQATTKVYPRSYRESLLWLLVAVVSYRAGDRLVWWLPLFAAFCGILSVWTFIDERRKLCEAGQPLEDS